MRLRKTKRRPGFTQIDNVPLNEGMSFQAKGLLTYLLSKPDDWEVNTKQLIRQSGTKVTKTGKEIPKNGRDSIRSMFAELVEFGYARVENKKDSTGKFSGKVYRITEVSFMFDDTEDGNSASGSECEKAETGKTDAGKTDAGNSDSIIIKSRTNKERTNKERETLNARGKISRTESGAVDVNALKSESQRKEIPQVAPPPLTEPEITPEMYIVTRVDPGPNSERMQVWKMKTGASYETIVAEIQVFASKHLARDYADVAEEKVLGLLQAGNEQRFRRVFESSFLSRIKPNQNNEYRTSSKNGNHTRKKSESEKWDAIFNEIESGTFRENQPSTEIGYL